MEQVGARISDEAPSATIPTRLIELYTSIVHGWSSEDGVVRCRSLGGFAVLPSPSEEWNYLETLPRAADCTILCPSPLNDTVALERLKTLLNAMEPDLRGEAYCAVHPHAPDGQRALPDAVLHLTADQTSPSPRFGPAVA